MVDITWQAFESEAPFGPVTEAPQTYVAVWPSAEYSNDLVQSICNDYFGDEDEWNDVCNIACSDASILVIVTEPPEIRGTYLVYMERVVKSRSKLIDDPRPAPEAP
jgi:hypothetical protein